MEVKEMLNKIMEKRQTDQQGLALLLGVDKAQVSRWLNGAVPKIENQRKIKKLYDETKIQVNLDFLMSTMHTMNFYSK